MSARVFTPDIKIEHVISFSDAVFAFAITLMALTIDIPDLPPDLSQSELLKRLDDSYPQLEDYIISFAVIAIFWISYHQVFNHIKGSHISMVYLNLLFLLFITLLSLTTSFCNKLCIVSDTIYYLLHSSNYDKFITCINMVVCHKGLPISRQRHASTIHKGNLLCTSGYTHNF